ncbi:TPA: glutathione peroxidase [Candidatus Sumerlaeota bacterium]|jgi:glutathione peroxidase|nr:glutathione peroxidase [Candidatus Sumerlaeota bacterium]
MSVYVFSARANNGKQIPLSDFAGKVLLIVNTASKCGFTPQYQELQDLYNKYACQGFEVLGFPCNQFAEQEPGSDAEVQGFCRLNYGVNFPLFAKTEVRGENAHPLFTYLTNVAPFQGFDPSHPIAALLQGALDKNFPDYLPGDSIKWNFTKFLIDRNGRVVGRYEPTTTPLSMQKDIEKVL